MCAWVASGACFIGLGEGNGREDKHGEVAVSCPGVVTGRRVMRRRCSRGGVLDDEKPAASDKLEALARGPMVALFRPHVA